MPWPIWLFVCLTLTHTQPIYHCIYANRCIKIIIACERERIPGLTYFIEYLFAVVIVDFYEGYSCSDVFFLWTSEIFLKKCNINTHGSAEYLHINMWEASKIDVSL